MPERWLAVGRDLGPINADDEMLASCIALVLEAAPALKQEIFRKGQVSLTVSVVGGRKRQEMSLPYCVLGPISDTQKLVIHVEEVMRLRK